MGMTGRRVASVGVQCAQGKSVVTECVLKLAWYLDSNTLGRAACAAQLCVLYPSKCATKQQQTKRTGSEDWRVRGRDVKIFFMQTTMHIWNMHLHMHM